MSTADVESREQKFWNERARTTEGDVAYFGDLVNTDDQRLVRLHHYGLSLLGDVKGKKILDCGCGYGGLSAYLAERGAHVTAIDISSESIAIARAWFRRKGVDDRIESRVTTLNRLADAPGTYDAVVGSFILHHLELDEAMGDIHRALKAGGRAVFMENNGINPVLMFVRNRILEPLNLRRGSADESPMDDAKHEKVRRVFPLMQHHYPEMIFLRLVGSFVFKDWGPIRRVLEIADTVLARLVPFTRCWSYFQVIELRKEDRP